MKTKIAWLPTILLAGIIGTPSVSNATDYYWIASNLTGSIADAANWSETQGGTDPVDSISEGDSTILYFDSDCTVTLDSLTDNRFTLKSMVVNANVTLKRSTESGYIYGVAEYGSISGTGKLILDNADVRSQKKGFNITCDVEIASGGGTIKVAAPYTMGISGALTGSGNANFTEVRTTSTKDYTPTLTFTGNLSGYTGTASVYVDNNNYSFKPRHAFKPSGATMDASHSQWEFYQKNFSYGVFEDPEQFPFQTSGATYKFGALRAYIPGTIENGSINNITLELGELVAADSSLTGSWGGSTGNKVVWKAASSNTLTLDCANAEALEVTNGGTVNILSVGAVPASIDFKVSGTLLIPYEAQSAVNAALAGSTVQPTIKFGSATLSEATDFDDDVTFADGASFTFKTCSLKAGDKMFKVKGTLTNPTFTILSPNTGTTSPFYGMPVLDTESVAGYTIVTVTYAADVFVWNGEDDAEWKTATAWMKNGLVAEEAPTYGDTVVIDSAASIKSSSAKAKNLLLLANLTLTSGSKPNYLEFGLNDYNANNVSEGLGKLILAGTGGIHTTQAKSKGIGRITVYNDIRVSSDASFVPGAYQTSQAAYLDIRGAVTGAANITVDDVWGGSSTEKPGYMRFLGDMSGYTGTITTAFDSGNSYLQFDAAATNIAGSVSLGSTGNAQPLCATAGTYTFGSLSGKVTGGAEAVKIVTEADSATEIAYTAGTAGWTLENAGSATVAVTGDNFSSYIASATGAFTLPSLDGASVTKVCTAANRSYPAVIAGESASLSGLTLNLDVASDVTGKQTLVSATSFSGTPTTDATLTQPDGRKFKLGASQRSGDWILYASDRSGLIIVFQ